MKINKLLLGLGFIASLSMISCSNEDPMNGGNSENGEVSYLAINIVQTPEASSRAEGDQIQGAPDNATYEEGLAKENHVESVRFYFFKADGTAASVVNGTKSYYDWTPSSEAGSMPNVEKVLTATIVLTNAKEPEDNISKDGYPAQVIAVLNPNTTELGAANLSMSTLRAKMEDYASKANAANPTFVMSNSVYLNGTTRIASSTIAAENVGTDPSTALANPVNIYVERTVAKVRLNYATTFQPNADGLIPLKDKDDNPLTTKVGDDDKPIFLKVNGWNVTATTAKGYLSKHVQASWASEPAASGFGTWQWNWAPYFRCFWAQNPAFNDAGQQYFSFNDITNNYTIGGEKNYLYTNENAGSQGAEGDDSSDYTERKFPTQVIIAGQLVDATGSPLEVAEYAGSRFVGESNLLATMVNFVNLYKITTVDGATVYTKITPADVKLITAFENGSAQEGQDNKGRYYVELALTDAATASQWAISNLEGSSAVSADQIKNALRSVGHAKLWKTGMTYYYFKIQHLGNEGKAGNYGVVRNHIYDCSITNIAGLGTPVYDPNQTIWPEKPEPEEDAYIAAKINILSWRVVNSNVNLDWNN